LERRKYMAKIQGKSPYQKYNKKPYRYSTLYQEWRLALKSGDSDKAQKLSAAHSLHWLGRREA